MPTKSFWLKALVPAVFLIFASIAHAKDYEMIEWPALMPAEDLEALLNPPEFISGIEDGSSEDDLAALENSESEEIARYQQALTSAEVVPAFNGKAIKLPGFIVPLESDDQQRVTEFFIVPYFGACLHLPPPPPNQIIYVKHKEGIQLNSLYDPFWFEGTLDIAMNSNELGTSAYTLILDNAMPYEE